jgi:hypothetical protein
MNVDQRKSSGGEGGLSILLMNAVFLVPLAMAALFYPGPTLLWTSVAVAAAFAGFMVSRKLRR